MADTRIVDYYSILNVPTNADLVGIENAYARLSSDLMESGDDNHAEALRRLNEAFAVLGAPERRAEYDQVFLKKEIARAARRKRWRARRQKLVANLIVGGVFVIVLIQIGILAYIGQEQFEALRDRF
ncbi:MAG TPA: DnaJ domain-containing protein [Tepidiformaceae bacterium]|jgi:curved DNA-binding protein CbpA